ncbi:hypothetical protein [Lederbergia lenta]|uniref:hypothetical protein n=1 Tax=Lederbergia lenta TaxID=1467 RepID=UPI00203F57D3|nr:hypothetical protein [Lederbergia lenta]MCM3109952.1 hypothetical protein [Lederbergia lenta]
MEKQEFTATDYFEYVKSKKKSTSLDQIQEFRENAIYLLEKYRKTNQIAGMKKLMFIINSIEKEEEAIRLGIDQFVYKQDIEDFISNVSSEVVKIIDLENYPREIPDDIIVEFEKVKDIFDKFYVVFTDYTGEVERQVEKSRIDKDPILFGTFYDIEKRSLSEKFYYIGDWIDEYCDLTLEKMVTEMELQGKKVVHPVGIPETLDELRDELNKYVYERGEYVRKPDKVTQRNENVIEKTGSIFEIVKSWFK